MRNGRGALGGQRALPVRLPQIVERLIRAGTEYYDTETRRGLIAANITGFLASISSLTYAVNYGLHDLSMLWPLVVGNVVSALCTGLVPLFHRIGPSAGAIWLAAVIFSTMFYFIAYLGRESGIQLNYIGAAPVAVAILGMQRLKLAAAITLAALACHLAAWFLFPRTQAVVQADMGFLDQIYGLTALSLMIIIFLVVFYAFRLASLAQAQTDALLYNIMPSDIAERLKEEPGQTIAERYEEATVLFADLRGFTPLAAELGPARIVALLDELFSAFDAAASGLGIEKIKTIGDSYMAVAGLPRPRPNHADAAVRLGFALIAAARDVGRRNGLDLALRIGIASGPVMAGVIGRTKFSYDAWGETVNLASRLQAAGRPGAIHASEATRKGLTDPYRLSSRQTLHLKGIGVVESWFVQPANGIDVPTETTMTKQWQYQVRIYLGDDYAGKARSDPGQPALKPLQAILEKHRARMKCQYDAFADYVAEAQARGTEKYALYEWTKATIEDPAKKEKYLKSFTLYVDGNEVYPKSIADALESDLRPLVGGEVVTRISKHDTNPANNPQPPARFRKQAGGIG